MKKRKFQLHFVDSLLRIIHNHSAIIVKSFSNRFV